MKKYLKVIIILLSVYSGIYGAVDSIKSVQQDLFKACQTDNLELLEKAIFAGADVNESYPFVYQQKTSSDQKLDYDKCGPKAVHVACDHNAYKVLDYLLLNYGITLDFLDGHHNHLLFYVNKIKMLEYLLNQARLLFQDNEYKQFINFSFVFNDARDWGEMYGPNYFEENTFMYFYENKPLKFLEILYFRLLEAGFDNIDIMKGTPLNESVYMPKGCTNKKSQADITIKYLHYIGQKHFNERTYGLNWSMLGGIIKLYENGKKKAIADIASNEIGKIKDHIELWVFFDSKEISQILFNSIESASEEFALLLIQKLSLGVDLCDVKDENGNNLLSKALYLNKKDISKYLLFNYSDLALQLNISGPQVDLFLTISKEIAQYLIVQR